MTLAVARPHPALIIIRACALTALMACMALALEYYSDANGTFCAAGGGCASVRGLLAEYSYVLPALGVMAFSTLFALTIVGGTLTARLAAGAALIGTLGALYLLFLQAQSGIWCWLCVVVDSSTLVAGLSGLWLLKAMPEEERLAPGFVTYWWAPFWVAVLLPVVIGTTQQDPPLPDVITDLYVEDAANIVEMADFECPYCREMHPVLRAAIEASGEDVHLVRILVPLEFHARARPATAAYFCAEAQGHAEEMADELFEDDALDRASFIASAGAIGLDLETFEACLDADETQTRIERDLARSEQAGMRGLPTVYIGGRTYRGFAPGSGPEEFTAAIRAAARGEGRRLRLWPLITLLVLVALSLAIPFFTRRRSA